jgi:hypothetical protein
MQVSTDAHQHPQSVPLLLTGAMRPGAAAPIPKVLGAAAPKPPAPPRHPPVQADPPPASKGPITSTALLHVVAASPGTAATTAAPTPAAPPGRLSCLAHTQCLFADPFVSFKGTERFKKNVSNLGALM